MVKIDTKTYFRIFYLSKDEVAANMAEVLKEKLLLKRKEKPGHALLVLPETDAFSPEFFATLEEIQSVYSSDSLSFIITPVPGRLKKKFPPFEKIHHAPTLRESIDIVMMEKLERELSEPDEEEATS